MHLTIELLWGLIFASLEPGLQPYQSARDGMTDRQRTVPRCVSKTEAAVGDVVVSEHASANRVPVCLPFAGT